MSAQLELHLAGSIYPDTETYEIFRARLCRELTGHNRDQTAWMKQVGYRPEDKDMGLSRWEELRSETS